MKRALLLLLLAATGVHAQQQYQTLEKGFQAEKLYQFGGIDNVNVFNGNLLINIPIGPSYALNGGLSYGLHLSYNSKSWDLESAGSVIRAHPASRSNAGMGWVIGMGRYVPVGHPANLSFADLYEAPDGGDHRFGLDPYTGGSHMRQRSISATEREVDSPDGVVRTFRKQSNGPDWELVRIRGPLGSDSVTIEYGQTSSQCPQASSFWKITDTMSRVHYVCFRLQKMDQVDRPMVDSVVLGSEAQRVYRFSYTNATLQEPPEDTDTSLGAPLDHTAPLLQTLTLPDQSSFAFTYHPQGMVSTLTLPTLGKIAYTYGTYEIPSLDFCTNNYGPGRGFGAKTTGVVRRVLTSAVPAGQPAETRTWTYTPRLYPTISYMSVHDCVGQFDEPGSVQLFDEMVVTVRDPEGNETANHFSVWPGNDYGRPNEDESPAGFERRHYGKPYGAYDIVQNRYLSREVFRCVATSCLPLQSVYVRHETEAVGSIPADDPDAPHRLVSERTVHLDDGDRWTQTDWSDWDRYGHHRTVTSTSNLGNGGDFRQVTISWNKVNGITRTIAAHEPWILNTYEDVRTTEAGETAVEQACFDRTSGFLRGKRTLLGLSPAPRDLLVQYEKDPSGNVVTEKYFGGDRQPLPVNQSNLCSALDSLAATPEYRIDHTWQFGQRATSQYAGASFRSLDLTIDSAGQVRSSRDATGLATTYTYDGIGRLTQVAPPDVAPTTYTYANAVQVSGQMTSPAMVVESTSATGGEVRRDYLYDSFGRLWRQKQLLPGNRWVLRETRYDGVDRTRSVSVPTSLEGVANEWSFIPSQKTTYQYDAFGRTTRITPPDGKATRFAYAGAREKRRTVSIAVGDPPEDVTTLETYDGQGRLVAVTEAEGTIDEVTARYWYDVGSRLTIAEIGAQMRELMYDRRGLLTEERHPELGVNGYGTIRYDEYDARGHAHRKTAGSFDLRMSYDAAERVTEVTEIGVFPNRPLQQFAYDGGFACAGTLCAGRLAAAARFHYDPDLGTIAVTESYQYNGRGGRLSRRDRTAGTTASFPGESFFLSQTYNDLGEVESVQYPCLVRSSTCNPSERIRTVTHGYTNGLLSSVDGWASMTYQPNGMIDTVTHGSEGSAVRETWTADPTGMARPQRIDATTTGGTSLWTSGDYTYDAAGNISAIGPTKYTYDRLQRLTRWMTGSFTGTYDATFLTYDLYGNQLASTTASCSIEAGGVRVCAGNDILGRQVLGTTNRYSDSTYDAAGNVLTDAGRFFSWDALGLMTRAVITGRDFRYLYSADGERMAVIERKNGANKTTWTVRDFANRALSTWTDDATTGARTIRWKEDNLFRGSSLLANVTPSTVQHYTLDHLGSPRLVTNAAGQPLGLQHFAPFGAGGTLGTSALQFTAHERDAAAVGDGNVQMPDYMHARYYDVGGGRFLSVDPDQWYTKQNGSDEEKRAFQINLRRPQGWNRYSYAYNNPIRYTDPDGRVVLVDDAAIGLIILGTIAVGATHTYLQSPNASDPSRTNAEVMGSQIQSALTGLMSPIIEARNNRQTNKVVNGLLAAAATELGKVSSAGGPEKDPDFRGHKKEIKAMLDRAVDLAKRLPKKAQDEIMRKVREIGSGVGLNY